jgi:hypothetical protein
VTQSAVPRRRRPFLHLGVLTTLVALEAAKTRECAHVPGIDCHATPFGVFRALLAGNGRATFFVALHPVHLDMVGEVLEVELLAAFGTAAWPLLLRAGG